MAFVMQPLRSQNKSSYNEKEARSLSHILLSGIKYIHGKGLVHRDLKPQNLLLFSTTDDTSIKFADFGFACSVLDGPLTFECGTPHYVAPEILKKIPYTTVRERSMVGVGWE